MKPFLLIQTRPQDDLAEQERQAFLRFGGLAETDLVQVRLEQTSLPQFDPAIWSGIILGGSPFDSSAPQESKSETQLRVEAELMSLLDQVVPLDFPFLGACYGVGTLALHQGGIIDTEYTEPAGAIDITITPAGLADPMLAGMPQVFRAFVGHHEACSKLPDGAELLASSATCPVQMFRIKHNLYGTQFHPELDVPGFLARISRYRHDGYFTDYEVVRDAAAVEDVSWAGRVIANFAARYGVAEPAER